jgi:succinylglutamate desuccinylase
MGKKQSDIVNTTDHIIGEYEGEENGPLIICMAGMHGNEPAGVKALETIFHLLEREPEVNPEFKYRGKLLGILGNVQAYSQRMRMIVKDLNRQWTVENVQRISAHSDNGLKAENREMKELLQLITQKINEYQPQRIVLLDLHTTSAKRGIFALASDDPESIRIATELHAPVITGMLRGIKGTTLHFFTKANLLRALPQIELDHVHVTGVAFEAGQHDDELSVNRCIAAIINCMRSVGAVNSEHVENRHDELLIEYSKDLPKIAELVKVHTIDPMDRFRMRPGYSNFQPVKKGEALADDRHGVIRAPVDGLILMPLYQAQGSDGFFIIKEINIETMVFAK